MGSEFVGIGQSAGNIIFDVRNFKLYARHVETVGSVGGCRQVICSWGRFGYRCFLCVIVRLRLCL